ncbi:MAG TPA: hypothetical protein GXX71_04355 [Acholeplasma sp.]|jgi:peptidyl-prolyl cis-trans isomerase B (cyclophilin B)|nr:hypothetical protein [Acholeplasma sp.]
MDKKILNIITIFVLLLTLVSCGKKTYTITFDLNEGVGEAPAQTLKKGELVTEPTEPTKEGYNFLGWYLNDQPYNFSSKVNKNLNLVARWEDKLAELKYYSYLSENNPVVTIKVLNFGEMKLELFPEVAPNTVNNFLKYVENNKYTGSSFHRVIKDFMIQGGHVGVPYGNIKGDFSSNGVTNNLRHYRGVISMARTMVPDSATSQFFIVHKTSPHLNGNYASFGGLISGFDVLDQIANLQTDYNDRPLTNVVIESVTVELNGYEPSAVIYV